MLTKIAFTPNVPIQVRLKYPEGKLDQNGRFGDQMFYTLSEPAEGCMYLNLDVAGQLNLMEPRKGEPIVLCKRWSGKKTESPVWDIWRPDQDSTQPAPRPQLIRNDTVEADLLRSLEAIKQQQRANQAGASVTAPAPVTTAPVPSAQPTYHNGNSISSGNAKPQTRLADALKTAVEAAHAAGEYAKSIGYVAMPQFCSEDIRAMAISVYIGTNR